MNFLNKVPLINKMGRTALFITMFVLITLISILTSFQPLFGNIPFNVIFPICCIIGCKMVKFERIKICTLLLMRILIIFVVLGVMFPSIAFISPEVYIKIVIVFLMINILEATMTDFKKSKNYFNAVSGVFMILATFFFFSTSHWNANYTYDAAISALAIPTICYAVAYTIWNWMFVSYEFKSPIALFHMGLLTIPFVVMAIFVNPFIWLLVRANSLTTGGVFQISNKDFLEEKLYNEGFENFVENKVKTKPVQIGAMVINIALLVVCGVFYFTTV